NCLGFNLGQGGGNFGQLGGQFGFQGQKQDQLLIALIRQVVGEPTDWLPPQCLGPLGGGVPPPDINEPGNRGTNFNRNSPGFYPPALALVVKGTSRIHTKLLGGVLAGGGKKLEPVAKLNPKDKDLTEVANNKDKDKLEPEKIWQDALAHGVSQPGMIIACDDFLFDLEEYKDATEFLKANLRQGLIVKPWVFDALAIALEASGATDEEIRRARLSAIDLQPHDPQGFLHASQAMASGKQWDKALAFCRR